MSDAYGPEHADLDRVETLDNNFRILKKQLSQLQEDLNGGLADLGNKQKALRASINLLEQKPLVLEDRISSFERGRDTAANSIEALSAQVMELTSEFNARLLPPGVQEAIGQVHQTRGGVDCMQECVQSLRADIQKSESSLGRWWADLKVALDQRHSELKVAVDAACKQGAENHQNIQALMEAFEPSESLQHAKVSSCLSETGQLTSYQEQCNAHQSTDVPQQMVSRESQSEDCNDLQDAYQWNEAQLSAWLTGRGLPIEIARAFERHLVNGMVAVDLNVEDLLSMGVMDEATVHHVLHELSKLFTATDERIQQPPSVEEFSTMATSNCTDRQESGAALAGGGFVAARTRRAQRPPSASVRSHQRPLPFVRAVPEGSQNWPLDRNPYRSANRQLVS